MRNKHDRLMLNKLASIFRRGQQSRSAPSQRAAATGPRPAVVKPRPNIPVYPPVDAGIEACDAETLIDSQRDLIHRLRLSAGLPPEEFNRLYTPVIEALAKEVGLLPASESGGHCGAGGLFRLALEVGFFALQASEAAIFAARAGVEHRRVLEPRWRYATWLAGTCCELYRPVTDMIVTSEDGEHWPTFSYTLIDWLNETSTSKYFVRWVEKSPMKSRPGRGAAATLSQRIIPAHALQYLHEGSNEIAPTMLDVITGSVIHGAISPMGKIIDAVREKVAARDAATRPQTYGRLTVGQHVEPHLLDAMRQLVSNGTWRVNEKKSRIWFGDEGLFLVWTTAAKEVLETLRQQGVAGIPRDQQTLLEILIDAQVFEPHRDGGPYWTIYSPLTGAELATVKFRDPLAILGSQLDEPASAGLLTRKPGGEAKDGDTAITPPKADSTPSDFISTPSEDVGATQTPAAQEATDSFTPAAATGSTNKATPPAAERDVSKNLSDDLAKGLDPHSRDVIGALIEDLKEGRITNQAGRIKEGFAIGIEQVTTYGIDVATFAAALQKAGWLYTAEDKPNRKIVDAQINGKLQRALVIRLPIAIDVGLVL